MKNVIERAINLHNDGRYSAAKRLIHKKFGNNMSHPDGFLFMGKNELGLGNIDKAIHWTQKAIDQAPLKQEYHLTLAEAYRRKRDFRRVEWECKLSLRLAQNSPEALNTLGLVYKDQNNYQAAIQAFSQAIDKKKNYFEAMNNLATVLIRIGDYDLAQKYLQLILDIYPEDRIAWNNLGLALRSNRRLEDAKAAFLNAGDYLPAKFNLGHVYLLEDNLKEGFPLYECRKNLIGIGKNSSKKEWKGKPEPHKTLLVTNEQGLGDAILMSRFYPFLDRYFKKIYIQTGKPLMRLMRSMDCGANFIDEGTEVEFDLWCSSMSLPYLLNIDRVEKIPHKPWFKIDVPPADDERLRIGINWAGNPSFHFDSVRSTHLKELELLFRADGIEWFSLHKGHLEKEADEYGLPQPLRCANDFYDTAVFIETLDMVISTETAIPNLAAALGVPTCVLCAPDYDWRWNSWYKKSYVCAQERLGNWHGSIAKALEVIYNLFEDRFCVKRSA